MYTYRNNKTLEYIYIYIYVFIVCICMYMYADIYICICVYVYAYFLYTILMSYENSLAIYGLFFFNLFFTCKCKNDKQRENETRKKHKNNLQKLNIFNTQCN